jgi:hypothetical protein
MFFGHPQRERAQMKRDSVCLIAACLVAGAPSTTLASQFDARRDAERVSDCMRAYKILEEAASGLQPGAFEAYERWYVTSWNRIRPFARASERAVGERQMYRRATPIHRQQEMLLSSAAINNFTVRNTLVAVSAAEAKACDKLVIGWGPPPKDAPP